MPMIEVTACSGKVSSDQRDPLMKRLTDTLLKWEGAPPSSAAALATAWSYFNEMPAGTFFVGGAATADMRLRVEITTPEGMLNDESRKGLVEEVAGVIDAVLGATACGFNHWVLLREIKEGNWGSGGQIFRKADIHAAIRSGKTS